MLDSPLRYYAAHYQAQPPLVRGRVLRPLADTELTEVCELLLEVAQHHDCAYWLLDGRADQATHSPQVYEWLTEEFWPRVRLTLGRAPCVAFIAEPVFWQALQARNYAPPTPALLSAAFRTGWFVDVSSAEAWLRQFRPAIGVPC